LPKVPSLLALLGFAFNFCGVSVGPQFPFRLYAAFTSGSMLHPASGKASAKVCCYLELKYPNMELTQWVTGFARLLLGVAYLAASVVAGGFVFPYLFLVVVQNNLFNLGMAVTAGTSQTRISTAGHSRPIRFGTSRSSSSCGARYFAGHVAAVFLANAYVL
jgi:hypothetical protein